MVFSPQPCSPIRAACPSVPSAPVISVGRIQTIKRLIMPAIQFAVSLPSWAHNQQPTKSWSVSPRSRNVCMFLSAGHNTIMMTGALRAGRPVHNWLSLLSGEDWVQAGYSVPQNVVNSSSDNRDVMRCSLVDRHRRFGGNLCRHFQDLCILLHDTFRLSANFPL
jgi:hypothetical protein